MRVCPNCGYVDGEEWRPAAFHHHVSYCYLSSLEYTDPELFKTFNKAPIDAILFRAPFVYWQSSRSETIRRAWVEDFKIYGKTVPQERVNEETRSINEVWTKGLEKERSAEIHILTPNTTLDEFTIEKQTKRIEGSPWGTTTINSKCKRMGEQ